MKKFLELTTMILWYPIGIFLCVFLYIIVCIICFVDGLKTGERMSETVIFVSVFCIGIAWFLIELFCADEIKDKEEENDTE